LMEYGVLTISLDFELYWGVRESRSIEQYRENLSGVYKVVPELMQLFKEYDIHATWAPLGFLFFNNLTELKDNWPAVKPQYTRNNLSPYSYIENAFNIKPCYHFAPELIDLIKKEKGQEIGTHTFSHYYCLEAGQTEKAFRADISAALDISTKKGIAVKSLIFPRNQCTQDALGVLNDYGISCYRGNQKGSLYKASVKRSKMEKALRLIDSYINLSGYNTYNLESCFSEKPYNFPASFFIRPYNEKFPLLGKLHLRRIKKAMEHAAMNKQLIHLWGHPHNFGKNIKDNMEFFSKILMHYKKMQDCYGMKSLNMGELCDLAGVYHAE